MCANPTSAIKTQPLSGDFKRTIPSYLFALLMLTIPWWLSINSWEFTFGDIFGKYVWTILMASNGPILLLFYGAFTNKSLAIYLICPLKNCIKQCIAYKDVEALQGKCKATTTHQCGSKIL